MIKLISEYGKGSKKTFAPPAQKLHSLIPYSLNSPKEETLGISSLETEARPNLLNKVQVKEEGESSHREWFKQWPGEKSKGSRQEANREKRKGISHIDGL